MTPLSVQVRGLLDRESIERYNSLFEVGKFCEAQGRFDLARTVQAEINRLAEPAVEKLMRYENRVDAEQKVSAPVIVDNRNRPRKEPPPDMLK